MLRNVTNARGAGGENRMASYAGIGRFPDYFLLERDCFFGVREARTRNVSRRSITVGEDDVHFRLLWQGDVAGKTNSPVLNHAFKCHAHGGNIAVCANVSQPRFLRWATVAKPLIDADER